jgi:hypothetical protein
LNALSLEPFDGSDPFFLSALGDVDCWRMADGHPSGTLLRMCAISQAEITAVGDLGSHERRDDADRDQNRVPLTQPAIIET